MTGAPRVPDEEEDHRFAPQQFNSTERLLGTKGSMHGTYTTQPSFPESSLGQAVPVQPSNPPGYEAQAPRDPMADVEQQAKGVMVKSAPTDIRMAFVRKVYTILAFQIGLTVGVGALCMFANGGSFKLWVVQNVWAFYVPMAIAFVSLFALFFVKNITPWNYAVLSLFTLCEAFTVGIAVSLYDSRIVLQAVIITFAIFVALTLFTFQSKWDFSGLGPVLYVLLWALIIGGLVQLFLPYNRVTDAVISVAGALVFCGYTVFDTYLILNRLSPEEYIIAAVELYLDLLNLFLYILRILSLFSGSKN